MSLPLPTLRISTVYGPARYKCALYKVPAHIFSYHYAVIWDWLKQLFLLASPLSFIVLVHTHTQAYRGQRIYVEFSGCASVCVSVCVSPEMVGVETEDVCCWQLEALFIVFTYCIWRIVRWAKSNTENARKEGKWGNSEVNLNAKDSYFRIWRIKAFIYLFIIVYLI